MAEQKLLFPVDVRRNNDEESVYLGKYYACSHIRGTLSTQGLADHIAQHGSLVTKEVIMLVLNQFQKCIPELLAQGVGISLDGLGRFEPKVHARGKARNSAAAFLSHAPEENISGVAINFIPVNEKLFSLASKAMKAKCEFTLGNYYRPDYYMEGTKKVVVPTLIPLDQWDTYLASGGSQDGQLITNNNNNG